MVEVRLYRKEIVASFYVRLIEGETFRLQSYTVNIVLKCKIIFNDTTMFSDKEHVEGQGLKVHKYLEMNLLIFTALFYRAYKALNREKH